MNLRIELRLKSMKKYIFLLITLYGCVSPDQKSNPDENLLTLDRILENQLSLIKGLPAIKIVTIDEKAETQKLIVDSLLWAKDLKMITELKFAIQIQNVSHVRLSPEKNKIKYLRKERERSGPNEIEIQFSELSSMP